MPIQMEDLTGRKFNMLTVTSFNRREVKESSNSTNYYWNCVCDCGNTAVVTRANLVGNRTKSCGCLVRINKSPNAHGTYRGGIVTHGMSHTRLYRIWNKMRERCRLKSNLDHSHYIDKNITVCKQWDSDFLVFKDWAMSSGYSDELSIDRIDNTAGYTPLNCRWATTTEQANNKTNNIILEYNGISDTLSNWARKLGITYCTLANRYKRGWGVERILTEKPRYQKRISS